MALGKTQTEFAAIAAAAGAPGATRQSQAKYEKGQAAPSPAYLAAIAAAGADVLYVLTGQRSQPAAAPALKPDEAALLDNYRHSPPDQQRLLKETSAAFAQRGSTGKSA